MQIEEEKDGNENVRLNMVCMQYRLLWLLGAQVHVQFRCGSAFRRLN